MADLTIVTPTALVTATFRFGGLVAGEELLAGSPCYIAADGLVYQSVAVADDEPGDGTAAEFDGFCLNLTPANSPVTLFGIASRIRLAAGLAIGDRYWASATKGLLSDTVLTTLDTQPMCKAVSATDVVVTRIE
jgi:hypothetical protein